MMLQTPITRGRETSSQPHEVFTNDDLLTQILIRLPILCIHLLTTVSKQWLQILTSHDFTEKRRKIPDLDPPAGIFANHLIRFFEYDFVSLDRRLDSKKYTIDKSFGFSEEGDRVRILQSCNGLILCCGKAWPVCYYVFNPSTNLYKRLPRPYHFIPDDSCIYSSDVFRLAFDPRKSVHYNVVQVQRPSADTLIQIYSSETGNWNICTHQFSYSHFDHFRSAMYWNDAFHWIEGLDRKLKHCILSIENIDHPILNTLDIPHGIHRGRNFLESFGGPINDPMVLLMQLPQMLHLEGKFFESRECLLLACRDDIGSHDFTIYDMKKGSSVWSARYIVNIDQLIHPLPQGWSIQTLVWSICLAEDEKDAFVVINISGKVVKYHLISKTITELYDIGSYQNDDDFDDDDDDDDTDDDEIEFIPTNLDLDPNLYEFIPSLASV